MKKTWKSLARAGLSKPEKAGNEEHHHHKTNNVDNTIHVSSSFLRVIGFTIELQARNILKEGLRKILIVVSPSDEVPWDFERADIIRIGVLHPVFNVFKSFL